MRRLLPLRAVIAAAMLSTFGSLGASAEGQPTAAQIIERLKEQSAGAPARSAPAVRTRGLSASPSSAGAPPAGSAGAPARADRPAVERLFSARTRGLSSGERAQAADIARARPAVDLVIYFDYNSAEISPKAMPTLVELGKALSSDALAGRRFMVAGHTDARGGDQYNLKLSERRANAIRNFLMASFHIDEKRLLPVGFGKEQLKNPADPAAGENRRVQVVNLGD